MNSHKIDYNIYGTTMQAVEITLDNSETVIAEAGAMVWMDRGLAYEPRLGDGSAMDSGLLKRMVDASKRVMSGESLFLTHFTNVHEDRRRVTFAAPYPGHILPIDLNEFGQQITCQRHAFLCAAHGTKVDIAVQKKLTAGLFGGEGFILQRLLGDGMAFLHAGGTVVATRLAGNTLQVDTGCLVAYTQGVTYDVQRVNSFKSAVFSGEGLFLATLSGHGQVWLQSLPFSRLADSIAAHAPSLGGERRGERMVSKFLGGR